MKVLWSAWLLWVLNACSAGAQSNAVTWRYLLLDASTIIDDCPICGRPTIPYPLRGTFDLVLSGAGLLFTDYRITNISFSAGPKEQPVFTVTGAGIYRRGGEAVAQQDLFLQTAVCNSTA